MSKPSLILIGAGGHARACIDVIEQHNQFKIAGLIGLAEDINSAQFDYKIIATDAELPVLVNSYKYVLITIGQIQSPVHRIRLYQLAIQLGFQLPVIISPFAIVSRNATIGAGSIVMHGAVVNSGSTVGNNCIINTRALVEHDVTVADHCHISTGAIINGNSHVGVGTFVGSGSIIKEGVTIGQKSVVGSGLTIRHNLADATRFVGG